MWEPIGPLPAAVYWRRRALAAAAGIAIAFVAMLAISPDEAALTTHAALSHSQSTVAAADVSSASRAAGAGGTDSASTGESSGPNEATTTPQTTGVPSDPGETAGVTPGAPATSGPVVAGPEAGSVAAATPVEGWSVVGASAAGTAGAPTPSSGAGTPAAAATPEQLRPDETPRAAPLAAPVPVPPTGPVPCTNAMIAVTAEIDRPVYAVGEHPVLRLVITDTSAQPCVRDLDSARQEIVVWSGDGKTRLWSSNDCGNPGGPDLRTLVPGQPVVFAVTWVGLTSAPGCAQLRTVVPAGAYRVVSRLDNDISAATPFRLTP
jgi:hypothetical protein